MNVNRAALIMTFLALVVLLGTRVGSAQGDPCSPARAGSTARAADRVKVVLTTELRKVSLRDSLVLDVALRNDGRNPIFVYADIGWGYGAGLVIHFRNDRGKEVGPTFSDDTMLPPPPSNDDPTMFARLDRGNFFGTRRELPLKEYLNAPGKYTLQIEYWSRLPCHFVDPKLQQLPAVWHEDGSIFSNEVPIDVVP